jgi:hypothetical protein
MIRVFLALLYVFANASAFAINPYNEFISYIMDEEMPRDTTLSKVNVYNCYGGDSALTQIIKYDQQGRIILHFRMDNEGKKPITKTELKYQGTTHMLISKTTDLLAPSVKKLFEAMSEYYEYDSLNRLIRKYTFDKDTSYIDLEEYVYNSDNHIYKITMKHSDRDKYVKDVLFYDNMKRLIRKDTYGPSKKIIYSNTIEYEGNRQLHYLQNDQTKELKEIYQYDNKLLMKKTAYKNDEDRKSIMDYAIEYFYNPSGFLIGEKVWRGNDLLSRVNLVYFHR